jgi:hypothetical protein
MLAFPIVNLGYCDGLNGLNNKHLLQQFCRLQVQGQGTGSSGIRPSSVLQLATSHMAERKQALLSLLKMALISFMKASSS